MKRENLVKKLEKRFLPYFLTGILAFITLFNYRCADDTSYPEVDNNPPVITSAPITEVNESEFYEYQVVAVDFDNDTLTRSDRNILEHHAFAGFVLLSYLLKDHRSFAARVAKEHHERRDGSGYPLAISLRDRMVEIIAVCDIYDALLSPRPYRPMPYDNRTALEEIIEMAQAGKLSWDVVQTLVSHSRKDRPHFRECRLSTEKRGKAPAENLYGVIVEKEG